MERPVHTGIAIALALTLLVPALAGAQPIIDRFAGGSNGDGGPATGASLNPVGIAADLAGNVYVADAGNHRVRRVDAVTGFISTVAGTGNAGYSGDGGPADEANLDTPIAIEVDDLGNLYISDRGNNCIRYVDFDTGKIDTVVGTGIAGYSGDNGPADQARLNGPGGMAFDFDEGALYIADTGNHRIRKVLSFGGIITYAGNGESGFSGDGGPATNASLAIPSDVAIDTSLPGPNSSRGDIYVADFANQRIRVIEASSQRIYTAAGSGQFGFCGDQPPEENCFRNPIAVEYDPSDHSVLVADGANSRVRHVPLNGGLVTTVAGNGTNGFNSDGLPPTSTWLSGPSGVAVHAALGILISDQFNGRIRRIPPVPNPLVETIAGNGNIPFAGDGGPALAAKFDSLSGLGTDDAGNIYVVDAGNHRVRKIDLSGVITTVAGSDSAGFSGDGGPATNAELNSPTDVVADAAGNLYISDTQNNRVRRVSPSGTITTILGDGDGQSDGDGGPATSASTSQPGSLALYENASGTQRFLYVVETVKFKVRVVNLNSNTVNRFAGTGSFGFSGDGGPATSARLAIPKDVAVDENGNVYIADTQNQRVRKVATNGIISTIAGNGEFGYNGDGIQAVSAELASPNGVAVGPFGNIYILDSSNYRVRVIDSSGTIFTAIGTGVQSGRIDGEGGDPIDDIGDGGPAADASLGGPVSLILDSAGNAFVCDNKTTTIRWVEDLASEFGSGAPQGAVFGGVRYATSLAPVPSVVVSAHGPSTETTMSSGNGSYDLSPIDTAPWLIEPSKLGGIGSRTISPLDASYVLQELVGLRDLTPAQQLACDVTGDGNLSALDATRILQRATPGSSTEFQAATNCGSDWIFIPDAASAPNQTQIDPLLEGGSTCRPGAIQFNPLSGQPDGQDFKAVVIGDCTGNWSGSGAATSARLSFGGTRSNYAVMIGPERRSRRRVRVPISIAGGDGYNALEVRLGYDPAALEPVRVRTRGDARNALVSWKETEPGEMTLMLASGERLATPARSAIVVDFRIIGDAGRVAIRSARALVDDEDARVRSSGARRRRR